MKTKQDWTDLLFEVQLGNRSCRNMADIILEEIEDVVKERDYNDERRSYWQHEAALQYRRAEALKKD